jgi:hypothetical protein
MNYRLATIALLASGVLTITACGYNRSDSSIEAQHARAAATDSASAWRVYYDLTHPDLARAGTPTEPDPAVA